MTIESNRLHIQPVDKPANDRYALILAGGEGTRLRPITRAILGDDCPKQFCPIVGNETLLDQTRDRTALRIAPDKILFSLTAKHRAYFEGSLRSVPKANLVVQPENRGTAPAILYGLMRLVKMNPDATVAFLPSDHYFSDDIGFMNHVEAAFRAVDTDSGSVVLLGIEAEKAETAYGWIEPVRSLFGGLPKSVTRVSRFWEKPTAGVAEKLLSEGCLWNSFVMVGKASTFLQMFRDHLPELYRMFSASAPLFGTTQESSVIRSIYTWIGETNFSTDVLEKATDKLLVMRVADVGWSDWGEPERVIGTLSGLGIETQWMQALAA